MLGTMDVRMSQKFFLSILLVLGLSPLLTFAEHLSCGVHKIDKIMVQGDRDDNHIHKNSFVVTLKDVQCNGKPYLILKNDKPSYSSMLSLALAAKLADKSVSITVNTSEDYGSATEISVIIVL